MSKGIIFTDEMKKEAIVNNLLEELEHEIYETFKDIPLDVDADALERYMRYLVFSVKSAIDLWKIANTVELRI